MNGIYRAVDALASLMFWIPIFTSSISNFALKA